MAITLFPDGRIIHSNGAEIASDKMTDQWRLNTDHTITNSTAYFINNNWERVDSDNFGQLGTGMTESSGIFTFPSTGIYLIQATVNFRSPDNTSSTYAYITTATDGSSFGDAALSLGRVSAANTYATCTCDFVFDVTNTSTHKVMLKAFVTRANTVAAGNSNRNMTSMTFTRLGGT